MPASRKTGMRMKTDFLDNIQIDKAEVSPEWNMDRLFLALYTHANIRVGRNSITQPDALHLIGNVFEKDLAT
jgi:hypothetical protein